MPLSTALIVGGIVFAFGLFAVVLAWGDYQTRNIGRNQPKSGAQDQKEDFKRAA